MTIQAKKCFKCEAVKPLEDFYKHPMMADGRVNKCKECNRSDVRKNRANNIEYYREYDRQRGNRQPTSYLKEYRSKYPIKYAAHAIIGRRVMSGKLIQEPCEICGSHDKVHAHHDDYALPLVIRWLCPAHHKQWHNENGEGKNAV